ncbi:MAG: TadE/TadG family type IV pilus assembly protein [Actinomycetota bacterium]
MLRQRLRDESGEAAEVVLVTPVLLLLVLLVLQFGLWYHAAHVAHAAAQEGVRAARLEGGTDEDGRQRAERLLARAGPTIVGDPVIDVSRDVATAVVEVRGRSVAVIPGMRLPIRARAASPVERLTTVTAP